MKNITRFVLNSAVGMIALATMLCATRVVAETVPQVVTVLNVDGKAQFSTDSSKSWQTLRKADVLKPGAAIRTAPKPPVAIMLGAGLASNMLLPVGGAPLAEHDVHGRFGRGPDDASRFKDVALPQRLPAFTAVGGKLRLPVHIEDGDNLRDGFSHDACRAQHGCQSDHADR